MPSYTTTCRSGSTARTKESGALYKYTLKGSPFVTGSPSRTHASLNGSADAAEAGAKAATPSSPAAIVEFITRLPNNWRRLSDTSDMLDPLRSLKAKLLNG